MQIGVNKNWFKSGIIIFFIVGLSGVYYQIIFLPVQAKSQENHKLILECKMLGEKIELVKHPQDAISLLNPIEPEYHYNAKLKKCFYYGGEFTFGNNNTYDTVTKYIIDVYTNKVVDSFACYGSNPAYRGCGGSAGNEDVFNKKRSELFEENEGK